MKNDLIISLEIISDTPINQKRYIGDLFGDYDNIEEILLNFDDSIYLKDNYSVEIRKMLDELDSILNEIDNNELYTYSSLYSPIWDKARSNAKEILFLINNEKN